MCQGQHERVGLPAFHQKQTGGDASAFLSTTQQGFGSKSKRLPRLSAQRCWSERFDASIIELTLRAKRLAAEHCAKKHENACETAAKTENSEKSIDKNNHICTGQKCLHQR